MKKEPIIIEISESVDPPSKHAESSISIDKKEAALYIFFSLDICDSTKMKSEVENWKDVILKLYDIQEEFKDIMHVWKYIGDEVIFCTAFSGIESLVKLINIAYSKIETVESELTKIADSNDYKVSVKGTMWLSYISSTPSHTNQISGINEFLGKQMDEGFRMTSFSSNNILLLDPKIVFIILLLFSIDSSKISVLEDSTTNKLFANAFLNNVKSLIDDYDNKEESIKNIIINSYELRKKIFDLVKNIFFIKYETLKGIWKNYPYPIYWYSLSQSHDEYPNISSNELLPVITDKINSSKFYSMDLMSVFDKAGIKSDIDDILGVLIKNEPSRHYLKLKNDTVQLYYSIACVKDGKVFIAKRCYERKHLKGVWEFGFQKHTLTHTCDYIRSFFLTEFGLKVEPITDGTIDNNLVPLHFCTTYRNTSKHNSILCCAEIKDEGSIEELKAQVKKHLETILKKGKTARYLEVDFVDAQDVKNKFEDLTLKDICDDAYNVSTGNSHIFNSQSCIGKQKAIVYFTDSVKCVLDFYEQWTKLENKNWYDLFSGDGGN